MTVSELERVGVVKKDYNGLRMIELTMLRPRVKATMAISPTEKMLQIGTFSIDRHENSHSFSDEVVFSVWGFARPVYEKRARNDGYYRVEIPVPLRVAIKMLEDALHKLWLVE